MDRYSMDKNLTSTSKLERSLNLPLLIFYGLGTTIGAGIYVLIGTAAGYAGMYAPLAFIAAAIGIIPTAASYAELSGRLPVSSGESAYVNEGFRLRWMSMLTGWMVIISGVVASAAIAIGSAGYISSFVEIPHWVIVTSVIIILGLIAIWGIKESVMLAALFTIIEAGGLIVLIVAGFSSEHVDLSRIPELFPPLWDVPIYLGIMNAGMIAVFAFIGFEDMVNVAEETKRPRASLPWAIFLTLGITAILYALVATVAVLSISPEDLALSKGPLSMVYHKLTGASPSVISAIAIFATTNTILVQFIMVSRVIYGMASRQNLFSIFSRVNRKTKTPILATLAVISLTLILALVFPIEKLAEVTSQVILLIWTLVNFALVRIKIRKEPANEGIFLTPAWVPVIGGIFCGTLLIFSILH